MYELLIFDWDDVFTLGSTRGYYACYHQAIESVGIELSPEEEKRRIDSKWGSPHRVEIEALLKEYSELIDRAVIEYEKALFSNVFIDELTLQPGSIELLNIVSKTHKLAIASGINPKLLKENIFRKFDIANVFDEIVTTYDVAELKDETMCKPHPFSINLIRERLGVEAESTLMIGDAKNDLLMAKSAGVKFTAVLTGHLSKDDATQLGADYVLNDVSELMQIL
jgi:HAD superfamily hydrolase (TIGR01509 family)